MWLALTSSAMNKAVDAVPNKYSCRKIKMIPAITGAKKAIANT